MVDEHNCENCKNLDNYGQSIIYEGNNWKLILYAPTTNDYDIHIDIAYCPYCGVRLDDNRDRGSDNGMQTTGSLTLS